jgi:hypothetical protein
LPVLADTGDDINENSIVAMLHTAISAYRTDRCGALSLSADLRALPIIPSVAEGRCPYNFQGSFAGVENG